MCDAHLLCISLDKEWDWGWGLGKVGGEGSPDAIEGGIRHEAGEGRGRLTQAPCITVHQRPRPRLKDAVLDPLEGVGRDLNKRKEGVCLQKKTMCEEGQRSDIIH